MNLETLDWSTEITKVFGIPMAMLPKICSSSEVYGTRRSPRWRAFPLPATLGDQQAALVGQTCFKPGEAKNTYGTGCFLLLNTGKEPVQSELRTAHHLAYKLGKEPAVYALEGSIAITGALVQWLRDNLGMISKSTDIEPLAKTVDDNGGVYFVPAFSGLYAPYWKAIARGVIAGLTRYVNKGHIARAVLEATAFQTREVVDAMKNDSGIELDVLRTDGGMVDNESADAVPGGHPQQARRAAGCKGNHRAGRCLRRRAGSRLLQEPRRPLRQLGRRQTWKPNMDAAKRESEYKLWKKAVTRTFDWVED